MEDTDYIFTFIKFGSETDMLDLLNNGTIYMNPINKFRTIEDNYLRGDNYEGISKIWNLPAGQFEIPAINHKGNYISMHIRESYENVIGNIYSLYCVSSNGFETPADFYIDERTKQFGSHFVMITDLKEFTRRIRKSLKLTGYKFYQDCVEYYNKNEVNGSITVFQKPKEFEYQNEYRFYVERNELFPLVFKLGDLKDIAMMHPVELIDEIRPVPNSIN